MLTIYLAEAGRTGTPLAEYLRKRDVLQLSDYYELLARGGKAKNGIVVASAAELPEWDTIINDDPRFLGKGQSLSRHLVLALQSDQAAGRSEGFLLTTREGLTDVVATSLRSKLTAEHIRIRAALVAEQSLIDVVVADWTSRKARSQVAAVTSSELHAWWDDQAELALTESASDLHLEITSLRAHLSLRIHGQLEPQTVDLSAEHAMALVRAMYNTMADPGSTRGQYNPRVHQDAIITRRLKVGTVRLRFSSMPREPEGVSVTLRLIPLSQRAQAKSPEQLGYAPDQCNALLRAFSHSKGLILFVGSTGAGKSTTAINLLMQKAKDNPGKKFRTVEQPVELLVDLPNVSQTTVLGSDFADTMRALLRQDPDGSFVGEIRDRETAGLVFQIVRTGHLAISTLHSDGAPSAYERLRTLGVMPADLASHGLVLAICYQKLVPKLCDCKVTAASVVEAQQPEMEGVIRRLRNVLNGRSMDGIYFRRAGGCPKCKERGVIGRSPAAEIFVPKPKHLKAIASGDSLELWRSWREDISSDESLMQGRTAFEHALWKMRNGVFSPVDVESEFHDLDEPVFEFDSTSEII
jgi:type II secretory ATPase GspE/PulE/Tfp pilus assembly ATPase PilB-like protein